MEAGEAVKIRHQVRLTVSHKQQQFKEENLRLLAQKAREEQAGIHCALAEDSGEVREKDQLRFQRHKEREPNMGAGF